MTDRYKYAKYFKIKWDGWNWVCSPIMDDGWNWVCSPIMDDEELKIWLRDGSLEEGDMIIEVNQRIVVVKKGDKLILESPPEEVIFT